MYNKYFLIGLLTPLIIVGLLTYAVWYGLNYLEKRDSSNYNDGYEVGRFVQLNEDHADDDVIKQNEILTRLAFLESSNGKFRKILDCNNKYSLGLYHFQATTVQDMYWRYYKQHITIEQAVEIAQDDEKATELARVAIFIKNEKYHWLNSMNKLHNLGII